MPYTVAAKNLMLDRLAQVATFYALHTASTLSGGASIGNGSITMAHQPDPGATITLDPGGPNEETHAASTVTGTGPYTVALSGTTLTKAHTAGESVAYTPKESVGPKEPTGGSPAYVRLAATWAAATGGSIDNTNAPEFDVAPNILITHVAFMSALTGGTMYSNAVVTPTKYSVQAKFRITDADMNLNS